MAKNIILAFGMPRSGTTWCGKILDSHPNTIYRHEPDTSFRSETIPLIALVGEIERYREAVRTYTTAACHVRTERVSASLPIFPKRYYSPVSFRFRQGMILATKAFSRYRSNLTVPDLVDIDRDRDISIIWKSIESLGRLGLFARVLENSRAIHILRHPCGQIASVINGEAGGRFTDRSPSSEDYGIFELLADTDSARNHGLTVESLRAMEPVERLAWRWAIFNEQAMLDTEGLENCTVLRYEDMCLDPESRTRELFAFTGLDWNDQTAGFISRSTGHNSERYYSVFKNPVQAMNRWRDTLPSEQIDQITAVVKNTLPGRLYFADQVEKDS